MIVIPNFNNTLHGIYYLQVMKNDKSWRAMLIKDNEGDWGICVAVWRGMKKGTPGVPGKITC